MNRCRKQKNTSFLNKMIHLTNLTNYSIIFIWLQKGPIHFDYFSKREKTPFFFRVEYKECKDSLDNVRGRNIINLMNRSIKIQVRCLICMPTGKMFINGSKTGCESFNQTTYRLHFPFNFTTNTLICLFQYQFKMGN